MKKTIRYFAAALLLIPSLGEIWYTCWHLWYLYASKELYSFGMNLQFGNVEIRDPWSDVLILVCASIATACGIAVAWNTRRKVIVWMIGAIMISIVAVGVIGMLTE